MVVELSLASECLLADGARARRNAAKGEGMREISKVYRVSRVVS